LRTSRIVIEIEIIVREVDASCSSSLPCMRTVNGRSEGCQQGVQLSACECIAVGSVPAAIRNAVHEGDAVVEIGVASGVCSRGTSSWADQKDCTDLLDQQRSCSFRRVNDCSKIQNGQIEADDAIGTVEGEESSLSQIVNRLIGTVEEEIHSNSDFVAIRNQRGKVQHRDECGAR